MLLVKELQELFAKKYISEQSLIEYFTLIYSSVEVYSSFEVFLCSSRQDSLRLAQDKLLARCSFVAPARGGQATRTPFPSSTAQGKLAQDKLLAGGSFVAPPGLEPGSKV